MSDGSVQSTEAFGIARTRTLTRRAVVSPGMPRAHNGEVSLYYEADGGTGEDSETVVVRFQSVSFTTIAWSSVKTYR